jgi:hypothetical protein
MNGKIYRKVAAFEAGRPDGKGYCNVETFEAGNPGMKFFVIFRR